MGANASTAVPTYASGQVLDADRLNLTNSGVPVFSGTATRDAAFGGSGEKTLAEGQLCYLEDSNAVQFYNGAAFGAVSGLTFITEATVTSSTSANFDNVFSATYDNYRVIISDITSSGGEVGVAYRMRVGGVSNTATEYDHQEFRVYSTGSTANGGENGATAGYLWACATSPANHAGGCIIDFMQPFLAKPTTLLVTSHVFNNAVSAYMYNTIGNTHTVSSSFDGFTIFQTTTTTAYKIKIYGYANS